MAQENAGIKSCEGADQASMIARNPGMNIGTEVTSGEVKSRDVANAETGELLGANVTDDEQDPSIDTTATGFGKQVNVAALNVKNPSSAHMYDPYTGVYVDPRSGFVISLNDNVELDENAVHKHADAAEHLKKLEEPACDHSRLSARIKIHGSATCPYATPTAKHDETGFWGSKLLPCGVNLNRVVTAGLTVTADILLDDMAACAFGTVDTLSDPIMSTEGTVKSSDDITDLPKTSTLLRKTHIIPDLLDSVEEDGVVLEIYFGVVQVFNGMIVDRGVMCEAPMVKLISKAGVNNARSPYLLLLIELESDGLLPPSEDYLQWMVADIIPVFTKDIKYTESGGCEVIEYCQMPFSKKDNHKHVFLLFKQNVAKKDLTVVNRSRFDVHDFINLHGLGAAAAAVYFESETCY